MEMSYRKIGRRYVPFEPFAGFMADGIWLVKRGGKSSTLTVKIDDLDGRDLRVVTELSKKYDDLVTLLIKYRGGTIEELAKGIIALLSAHEIERSEETW